MTSPAGYGLLGPSAAMAITSLTSTPATPSPMALTTAVAASTTPPSSLGIMSPRLTPKESNQSDHSSDGSNSQVTSGGGQGCPPGPPMLTMPPLPLLPSASSDDELEQKHKSNSLFSSFLPIRQLRLRAQEHLEAATASANLINKENGFDSSSSPAGAAATTQS